MRPTKKQATQIVPVGNQEIGVLYFVKLGYRTVGEREALDETELNQNKGQFLLAKLAGKIAEDKGIKVNDAYNYIFPSGDGVVEEDNASIMVQYPDEIQELMGLRSQTNRLKDEVATILMQRRAAYPVEIAVDAAAGTESLFVQPLPFSLKKGDRVKFGVMTVEITENHLEESEVVRCVPLSAPLGVERVGFVLDFETGKNRLGSQEWTKGQTATLPEPLVDEIYSFYQREVAGLGENEADEKNDQALATTK